MKLRVIYEPKGRAGEYAELAANLYRGCGHGCSYCYAPSSVKMRREEFANAKARVGNILEKLDKDAAQLAAAGDERPVMLSFTCDPYQPLEEKLQLTRRAIVILKKHGRRVEILTKGGTRAVRDFGLLGEGDAFAATLTFANERDSLNWEPHAAKPYDRIQALRAAHQKYGLRTWASIEPVIDPDQSLGMIWNTIEVVDLYKLGAWNYDERAKAIDWAHYHQRAVTILARARKDFIVKHDLRELAGVDEAKS